MTFRRRFALVLAPFSAAIVAHAACTPAELQSAIKKGSIVAVAGEKCLLESYEADQMLCTTKATPEERAACVRDVRTDPFWVDILKAIEEYRVVRCTLEPLKCQGQGGAGEGGAGEGGGGGGGGADAEGSTGTSSRAVPKR